jgi:hypothetical protein
MSEITLNNLRFFNWGNSLMESNGTKVSKSPEVLEKASRRRYSKEYKERTVREAIRCSTPEELGALLRREGLYSGAISCMRCEAVRDVHPGWTFQHEG